MKWILISILFFGIVLGVSATEQVEKLINTQLYINTSEGYVYITTENTDYEYNCNNNNTYSKTITLQRNFSLEETSVQVCSRELDNLALTCNRTIGKIDEILKDSSSYSQLYVTCDNSLKDCQSKQIYETEYNECVKEKESLQTSITSLNNDINSKGNQLSTCMSDRDRYSGLADKGENKNIYIGVAGILGFGVGWWFFVKRKTPQSPQERLM